MTETSDAETRRLIEEGNITGLAPEDAWRLHDNDLNYLAHQCVADSVRYFPKFESEGSSSTGRLLHYAIGMSTEANEFLEIMKKIDRGSLDFDEDAVKALLEKEAVDALIYLMNAFGEMGIDPLRAYYAKRAFNNGRFNPKSKPAVGDPFNPKAGVNDNG